MSAQSLIQNIFREAVERMEPVFIDPDSRKAEFEIGSSTDLQRFVSWLNTSGKRTNPIVWLAPFNPTTSVLETWSVADITLNLCVYHDDKDKLNVDRIEYTLRPILEKMWEQLRKELRASHQFRIQPETFNDNFFGNYKEGEQNIASVRWDVYQVGFEGYFKEKIKCIKK